MQEETGRRGRPTSATGVPEPPVFGTLLIAVFVHGGTGAFQMPRGGDFGTQVETFAERGAQHQAFETTREVGTPLVARVHERLP
jgi:hypothetical protein